MTLCLATGDPIFPAGEPRAYDSKIEERFARDFRRAARDWEIVREPEPVVAGDALLFPDFVLRHRCDEGERWLLEIVGFWTPSYLATKLERLREAGIPNLLLCNDHVLPGLGLEGTLLSAWAAARAVGRSDGRHDAFRRGLFRWLR